MRRPKGTFLIYFFLIVTVNTEKVFLLEYLFTFLDFTLLPIEINVIFPINWNKGT